MTDGWMNSYQARVNAETLARQAPDVQRTAKEILEEIKSISQYMYWSLSSDNKDEGRYEIGCLIDHAHALVDLGHAWRAVLKDNPPPKEDEDDAA